MNKNIGSFLASSPGTINFNDACLHPMLSELIKNLRFLLIKLKSNVCLNNMRIVFVSYTDLSGVSRGLY
jgi:hypothetical protein